MSYYKKQYQRPFTPPTGPTQARILKSKRANWFDISTPYNADFVSNIKTLFATSMRSYNPDTKMWSIHSAALGEIVNLLNIYFDEVINCVDEVKALPTGDIFGELFKMVPKEYADKVYLALSQAVHPDHGGSNEDMTKLNQAYQNVKK
jgi:hypothetical protein